MRWKRIAHHIKLFRIYFVIKVNRFSFYLSYLYPVFVQWQCIASSIHHDWLTNAAWGVHTTLRKQFLDLIINIFSVIFDPWNDKNNNNNSIQFTYYSSSYTMHVCSECLEGCHVDDVLNVVKKMKTFPRMWKHFSQHWAYGISRIHIKYVAQSSTNSTNVLIAHFTISKMAFEIHLPCIIKIYRIERVCMLSAVALTVFAMWFAEIIVMILFCAT